METEQATKPSGLKRFQAAILSVMQERIKSTWKRDQAELGTVFRNYLLDLPGPRQLSRTPTAGSLYVGRVFRDFIEIYDSVDALEDIEFLAGRFPFANTRITREKYLQFVVESHLAEVYLLQQRLLNYATLIERKLRKDPGAEVIANSCKMLRDTVLHTLQPIVKLRGLHTHVERYSDEKIKRLKTFNLLTNSDDQKIKEIFATYYQLEYRNVRSQWKKQIKNNNDELRKLLDYFFDIVYPIVFNDVGQLRMPVDLAALEASE